MKKERLHEIDILRAIAFIFVVVQHTLGGFSYIEGLPSTSFTIMKLLYIMAKPAVPIFLFISATALFYMYSEKFNGWSYYLKRVKYVLIPYMIWSAINMLILGNEDRFKNFFLQIFAGNGAFHLWYMGMVLRLFLIFPLILWLSKKVHSADIKIRIIVFIFLVIMYYPVSHYQTLISDNVGKFIFGSPSEVQQRIVNISALFWYVYFVLGIYLGLNYKYIKDKLLQYKAVIFVIYGASFIYVYLNEIEKVRFIRVVSILYMILSVVVFYIISVNLVKKIKVYKLMKFIGDYSFAAYMAHIMVVNSVANQIMITLNTRNYLIVGILDLIITSLLTPVLIKCISYIPFSEYVTGVKASVRPTNLRLKALIQTWIR